MLSNQPELSRPREFPPDAAVSFKDLPYLVDPIIAHIANRKPDVVIANDRGARLATLALRRGWKQRFGQERLPGRDNRIHFTRISSVSMRPEQAERATHALLGKVCAEETATSPIKIMLFDDWIDTGETFRQFERAVRTFGLASATVSFATLCGDTLDGFDHFVSDPLRNPKNSMWNAYDEYAGVTYTTQDPTMPVLLRNSMAAEARARIEEYSSAHYQASGATGPAAA